MAQATPTHSTSGLDRSTARAVMAAVEARLGRVPVDAVAAALERGDVNGVLRLLSGEDDGPEPEGFGALRAAIDAAEDALNAMDDASSGEFQRVLGRRSALIDRWLAARAGSLDELRQRLEMLHTVVAGCCEDQLINELAAAAIEDVKALQPEGSSPPPAAVALAA